MAGDVAACDTIGAMSDWLSEAIFGSGPQYHAQPEGRPTKSDVSTKQPSEGTTSPLPSGTEAISSLGYWVSCCYQSDRI